MGQRGPPPKPIELKLAEDTFRSDRDAGREAQAPPAGPPPCPPGLNKAARRIWEEVAPRLVEMGTLTPADGGTLAGYCTLLAHALKLTAIAAKEPMIGKSDYSSGSVNPAGVEARKLWPVVGKLATALGLNYAARSRT